jgi:nucleotide-binding universal stress UspA family protein
MSLVSSTPCDNTTVDRILVGLDHSPRAHDVLAAAALFAERSGAKLHIFSAVGLPYELPPEALGCAPSELAPLLTARALAHLHSCADQLPKGLVCSISTAIGVPWQAICQRASELDCSLIVIGSHGYTAIDRFLGTTAAKVVNHADRSVLVVRPSC